MCYYASTLFECHHQVWGIKVRNCDRAHLPSRDRVQNAGLAPFFSPASSPAASPGLQRHQQTHCFVRQPHVPQTWRVAGKCETCRRIDDTLYAIKTKVRKARETLAERWPEHACTSLGDVETLVVRVMTPGRGVVRPLSEETGHDSYETDVDNDSRDESRASQEDWPSSLGRDVKLSKEAHQEYPLFVPVIDSYPLQNAGEVGLFGKKDMTGSCSDMTRREKADGFLPSILLLK